MRNSVSEKPKSAEIGQKTKPRHLPKYPMHYGKSLASGRRSGGHYWNPPADCDAKRILFDTDTGERWVDVGLCKACQRHKKGQCEAHDVKTGYEEML